MSDLVLGVDASTTSVKAIVFDRSGRALASGRSPLELRTPRPGWHEQEAEDWWRSCCAAVHEAVRAVDPRHLRALALSIQRETFVLVDAAGEPIASALIWMDERARPLMGELEQRLGSERVHRSTGKPLSANLTLAKLAWIAREQPGWVSRARAVLDVHAFLCRKLAGEAVASWASADPGGLFSMARDGWDEDLIRAVGFKPEQFPRAAPPGQEIGRVTAEAASQTGLPQGLPLIAGLGDGQAAGMGAGIIQPGEAFLNLGTAVVMGACADRYMTDPAFRTHYAGLPGRYDLETVLLGGAYTLTWFLERFAPGLKQEKASIEAYESAASSLPAGAEGLMLVPYWNTVLSPYYDASATGLVVGWRGIHTLAHLYRAILEGIALELRLQLEGVEAALQRPIGRLAAVGGGAKSALWRQIIADVTGKAVALCEENEASALGAAMLAGWGAGLYPSAEAAVKGMSRPPGDGLLPDAERSGFYEKRYREVYKPLFPAVRTIVDRLAGE